MQDKQFIDQADCERLREIQEQLKDLVSEAKGIIRDNCRVLGFEAEYERARSYVFAALESAIDSDHGWLNDNHTLDKVITEMEDLVDYDEEDDFAHCD